jgi:hypothetical protein
VPEAGVQPSAVHTGDAYYLTQVLIDQFWAMPTKLIVFDVQMVLWHSNLAR